MNKISMIALLGLQLVMPRTTYVKPYEWREANGYLYWFEEGKQQGMPGDPKNIWDANRGKERGREIFDPSSQAWYWLDATCNGARAANKEVWMPYVYQSDLKTGKNPDGKWVRYDSNGRMIKGWYSNEKGTYYYKEDTGAMVKGDVAINGVLYHFDNTTGILMNNRRDANAKIERMVQEAIKIASDDSHGYDQTHRQGPDYDCSSLVDACLKQAGIQTKWVPPYTGNQVEKLTQSGFVYIAGVGTRKRGDILYRDGHTGIYLGNNKTVEALYNEFGGITGGKSGDQTGREICVLTKTEMELSGFVGLLRYVGN